MELGRYLQSEGYALQLRSLPHISVAGACARPRMAPANGTAILPSPCARWISLADGEFLVLSRESEGDDFDARMVVSSARSRHHVAHPGPRATFDVRQDVYENLSSRKVERHFDAIGGAGTAESLHRTGRATASARCG